MGGSAWEGHAPLKAALDGLATAKGVSATRVKAVATAAFQFAKDYKRVVHDVEIFLWKAEVEHRLAGLYAMDAIMRQSQAKLGAKDPFVKRFLLHMTNTLAAIKKIPADQQENVRHVVEEWQTRGYYTSRDIEQAGGLEYSLANPGRASAASSSATRASPTHADPASKEKLASLLSIIKKQKELKGQQSDQPLPAAPLLSQPPLLPTPTTQRARMQESPGGNSAPPLRSSFEDRQQGRSSDMGGYPRDQGTPSRDRGSGSGPPRARERSRSRDRGGASGRPRDRSRSRDRDRPRDRSRGPNAGLAPRDRRGSSPPSSPGRNRGRRDSDFSRRDSFEDSRDAKKPRSSRWGPPRPSDSGGDDNRPPVVDTRDRERSTRFESRSPRNRYDGPPGAAAPAPGHGSWPPTGYQGPPPPFRSGPPPSNSLPPPGPSGAAGSGLLPPPSDRGQAPTSHATSLAPGGGHPNGAPRGPGGDYNAPFQGVPPRSTTPENAGDQPMGSSGEICRKFVAGRCTFGDRCWHIHNQPGGAQQQDGGAVRAPTEMNQARRKTVLCANFPQGTCRFGDRCSFAHGEDDLDKSGRRPPPVSTDPMRGPSPRGASSHGSFQQQQQQRQSPAVSTHQPYPSGRAPVGAAARPPYNDGSGLPPSNAAPQPASGANQWAGAAAASGYGAYGSAPTAQTSQAYHSSSSGGFSAPTTSSAPSAVSAPPSSSKGSRDRAPSRDDDEPEAAGPEFTLQYDEDD